MFLVSRKYLRIWLLFLTIGLIWTSGCQDSSIPSQTPSNQLDSISYALGMDIALFYQKQSVQLNSALVYQGIDDILQERTPHLTEDQALEVLQAFRKEQEDQEKVRIAKMATENLAQSQMFFRENRGKEGVVELASGLQYKVLAAGNGASPVLENVVKVKYTGSILGAGEFDSSERPGGANEIKVSEAIPGMSEALLMMKPGDKWELYIPPSLAYGEQGFQQIIPPNSVLIYEVELLEILR